MNLQTAITLLDYLINISTKQLKHRDGDCKVNFAYAVIKNKKILQEHINNIAELQKKDEKFLEYEKKRIELCEKYCEKDSENKPIKDEKGNYKGLRNNVEFIIEINKLREEYKEHLYENDIEVDIHKVKRECLPINDDLTIDDYAILDLMTQSED